MNLEDRQLLLEPEKLAADKKAYENAIAERQKFLQDWRDGVLNSPQGRRIVWDILGLLGYQKPMFSSDPLKMAANCGMHDQALLVLIRDLEEAQPGILFRIQNEFRSAQAGKKD